MRAPKPTVEKARALRRALTLPEVLLWQLLRGGRLSGFRFRRQHPVGPFVLDFYCSEARLAVEIDGAAHDGPDRAARDDERDAWLAAQGIHVLRFPARDLLTDAGRESVLATIAARLLAPSTALRAVPLPVKRGRTSAAPSSWNTHGGQRLQARAAPQGAQDVLALTRTILPREPGEGDHPKGGGGGDGASGRSRVSERR